MNRNSIALLLALVSSTAFATDLRIYPTFTEVRQPASQELTFPAAQWRWIQPGSFSLVGVPSTAISLRPAELDWLRTQEGKSVTWMSPGRPAVPATLTRVDDLLIRLKTGEYVNAQRSELAFSEQPPVQGGMTLKLSGVESASLVYRTQALFWKPRYELNLNGAVVNLAALAQITNLSDQVFSAQTVDLYGGSVQQNSLSQAGSLSLPSLTPAAGNVTVTSAGGSGNAGMEPITPTGEVRGLQRYVLPGGLQLGRGESLTLPFLKPRSSDFTRYASVQSYFDAQNHSGTATRHYKFTSSQSLPAGPVDVREGKLLVGSVPLPAVQAGRPVDLDLGSDVELRYEKTVKRIGQEKNDKGQVLSTSYQVTYRFVSTRQTATRISVREQLYGRSVSVDGQSAQNGQVVLNRQVDVLANGTASLSFRLKIMN